MLVSNLWLLLVVPAVGLVALHTPARNVRTKFTPSVLRMASIDVERRTGDNVEQIKDTSRDKVMTFSYDMSLETGYEKPTYPGTGNGLGGNDLKDEYDVIVIGSGMGGLACAALSAEYGSDVAVLESHIKPGGSAHTFSRMHKGGKYSFEVGPSIFEGLNGPSLNPLRTILDMLGEDLKCKRAHRDSLAAAHVARAAARGTDRSRQCAQPLACPWLASAFVRHCLYSSRTLALSPIHASGETYTGLGYWTPEGYWRFPVGSAQRFEELIYQQCGKEEGDKAVAEWAALRKRLKTLGGSTSAVSLVNLRQDAGVLATTAGATPCV